MAGQVGPLIVVVGETASGKSALAMKLAEHFGGEIIAADSRTVYRGMDIGTAKPPLEERRRVSHHCLDLVDPDEPFTAADFKREALAALDDISKRDTLPIMVGGTGLYVDAVLYDYQFRAPADPALRAELQALSVEELQQRLQQEGIALPNNPQNPRHLVRALETAGQASGKALLRENTLIFGIKPDREELLERVTSRVDQMLVAGLEQEVRRLADVYGWNIYPMQTIGYQEWQEFFAGTMSLEEVRERIIRNTIAYAKRQRTWFRRNNSVHWFGNRGDLSSTVDLVTTVLNK